MSFDSRFPNLFRVKDAPGISLELRAACVTFSEAVIKRVPGVKCAYNAVRRELFFYFIDPSAGPVSISVCGEDAWPLDQRDIDDTVAVLSLSLRPLRERLERQERAAKEEEKDSVQKVEKNKAERRPELQNHADFLSRKRRGLQKTSVFVERPSGLVLPHDNGALT